MTYEHRAANIIGHWMDDHSARDDLNKYIVHAADVVTSGAGYRGDFVGFLENAEPMAISIACGIAEQSSDTLLSSTDGRRAMASDAYALISVICCARLDPEDAGHRGALSHMAAQLFSAIYSRDLIREKAQANHS